MTVKADPAPKPAAVKPAASPRRSENHFRALPMQVPLTAPPDTADRRGDVEHRQRAGDGIQHPRNAD